MKQQNESAFWIMNAGAVWPAMANGDNAPAPAVWGVGRLPRAVDVPTTTLFVIVSLTALIAVPLFGYLYGYTCLDWVLFGILYLVSGLGITVGYHRLIAHGSFHCPDWVKALLLVAGSWALGVRPDLDDLPAFALFLGIFSFLYCLVPLAFWGQTLGMVWAGLVARNPDGEPLTFDQSAWRWMGMVLTLATAGLALVTLLFSGRRSLTDRISGSLTLLDD